MKHLVLSFLALSALKKKYPETSTATKIFKSFKLSVIIFESNLASSSDMLCILVSSYVLNEEAPQDPASSCYMTMLQSCWILISIGLSTVTSFKVSWQNYMKGCRIPIFTINLLATDFFLQILACPVFKMWVIQKPNKVALWNKRHFEEEKMEIIQHV